MQNSSMHVNPAFQPALLRLSNLPKVVKQAANKIEELLEVEPACALATILLIEHLEILNGHLIDEDYACPIAAKPAQRKVIH